ncbi:protein of unknown function [Taphrina deformans PYCC 5710]|uniref:CRAL-TRIO domain-containing protein n=1 Tax=Taphrina deformans (strain PYCC 5710 / ATCC 11124 / CBS 356.35 / IMI 108563 / JCM 9778 / NBRC 8474) TaxID=1097556 RepID=S0BEE2_TAPDE|nr:protein of unknown function [Taphrina deformans PYCC 5710]|eukprot:CCG84898.1 protein of unknown function [Taphrina deformans PYCC 5710]
MSTTGSSDGWPKVSVYENPGNLSAQKVAVLKEFWAKLLTFFTTELTVSKQWDVFFPATADEPETPQFRSILDDFTPASFRDEFYKFVRNDYADLLPMRFLQARSYEQDRAMRMLFTAMSYRKTAIPRAMMSEAKNDGDFIQAMKKGKSFVPCYDNQGRTITCIRIKNHVRGDCSQDIFERYTLYAMEHAHLLHHQYEDRTVLLVDMSGFSITSLDLSAIKFIIQNFEQYYPEELSEGVIHNAPWLFGTAWSIIKPLLRGPTRDKITFTSNLSELAAKIGRLPAERCLMAQMQYIPKPDSEAPFVDQTKDLSNASPECQAAFKMWNDNIAEFETITKEWTRPTASDAPLSDIESLNARRAEVIWRLSKSYWLIDEYVRPKSYYDRAGLLPPSKDNALTVCPAQKG